MVYKITFTVFLTLLLFTANAVDAESKIDSYKKAREAFMTFNPPMIYGAIDYYNTLLTANPNDANAYAGLAESYSILGYYKKDIHEDYENEYNLAYSNILKALKLDKENINVKRALAYNYLYLSREKEAARVAREILAKHPDDYETLYIIWSAKGQKIDNPNIQKALRGNPGIVIGYVELAKSYFYKKRKYSAAAVTVESALKYTDNAYMRDLLGTIYRTQRSLQKSIEQYDKALIKDSNFPPALKDMGISLFYKGRFNESIVLLKKSINLNPTFPDAYFYLASNYQKKGDKDLARVTYIKFLEEASDQIRYTFLVKKAKQNLNTL